MLRRGSHPDDPRRGAGGDRIGRDVAGDDRAGADDRVVADGDAAEDLRSVADPDVGADDDVALVDALLADRLLGIGDVVVEVDEHDPVGDHALLADADVLVGRDRAFLPEHRLRADLDLPLVTADLRAVAEPDEAPEADLPVATDLQLQARTEEQHAVGPPAPPGDREQATSQEPQGQRGVLRGQHPVRGGKSQHRDAVPARCEGRNRAIR